MSTEKLDLSRRSPARGASAVRSLTICLATYQPDSELLARTLASIRAQSFSDWTCVVRDDASGADSVAMIRSLIDGDDRFVLRQNAQNVGYVANFEALLNDVPAGSGYVALADQDDVWYPDKLRELVEYLERHSEAALAYHNVKLADSAGIVTSATYDIGRPPRGGAARLDLLMANLVTGWTCAFRHSLLDRMLPFPFPRGQWVHDHWIAFVARSQGEVAYLAQPLGEYIQHGRNVVGAGQRGVRHWASHIAALLLAYPVGLLAGLTGRGVFVRPTRVLAAWSTAQYGVRRSFVLRYDAGAVHGNNELFPFDGRLRWLVGVVLSRRVAGGEAWAALLHFVAGELARHGRLRGRLMAGGLRAWKT